MTPSRKIKLINSTKQKCEKGLNLTTCFGRVLVYLGKIVTMKNCLLGFMVFMGFVLRAEEGMLIPSLLQAFESDMKARGMKLSAADIYSVNKSSLKDAIMHYNGGCTAELVSDKGLMLTNHHCGLDAVQRHSSTEHDYLKNGFWAKTFKDELPNAGSTATRIVRIEDVTEAMMFGIQGVEDGNKIGEILKRNMKKLIEDATRNTHFQADVQAFDYGNSFYLMVKEVFTDVRLVGAPPSSIGKFGGDTDNWVWPRHTGDFSVFRVYAGKDNKPAAYNEENVPYTPIQYLKIAFNDRKVGDFTMVYGFPGQTEQHLTSGNLKYYIEKQRPMEIDMRTKSLAVINEAMTKSDLTRIQYMAKQARIANAWKKYIGQIDGLKQLDAVSLKKKFEDEYVQKAKSQDGWNHYGPLVDRMNQLVEQKASYEFTYTLMVEYLFVGPEFFRLARTMEDIERNYAKYKASNELDAKIQAIVKSADGFFKNYDVNVDKGIFEALTPAFRSYLDKRFVIGSLSNQKLASDIYSKSIFVNKEKYVAFLSKFSEKSLATLKKDPGYKLFVECFSLMRDEVASGANDYNIEMDALLKDYVEGKLAMFPDAKHWPDANSTLRVTYGLLEGSAPVDGMAYTEHTTLKGMVDKYNTGNPDFDLDPRMIELYKSKNYANYAQNGELWVCFTGSNHTTGGNSGSPVLDANGNLMGLNFDRSWESTMSDFYFDPNRCRNIVVDIRYVMWVMDVYCGAKHLVDEMTLVK